MLKANATEAMDRLCDYYQRRAPDRVFATISAPTPRYDALVSKRGLDTEHARPRPPVVDDLDLAFDLAEAMMEDHFEVEDDSIPAASPNSLYGDYIFGALLDAPIEFYGTDVHTWSWTEPLTTDIAGLATAPAGPLQLGPIRYDPEGEWTQRCLANLRYGVARAQGRYALCSLLGIEALNLCVMVLGAQPAYTAIHDHPEALRRLMAFGVEFNWKFAELERQAIRAGNEQAFSHPEFAAQSLFHSGLSISVDAYDLCNVDVYRRMGREFQIALIERCGLAAYHMHGDGRHLIPEVASLPHVISMNIQDDMHEILPRAFDLRAHFRELTGDVPLNFVCHKAEFLAALEEGSLPGGTLYTLSADSVAEANAIMRRVREYRV
jgi:hypothetical protein